jgi:hypothetical protein
MNKILLLLASISLIFSISCGSNDRLPTETFTTDDMKLTSTPIKKKDGTDVPGALRQFVASPWVKLSADSQLNVYAMGLSMVKQKLPIDIRMRVSSMWFEGLEGFEKEHYWYIEWIIPAVEHEEYFTKAAPITKLFSNETGWRTPYGVKIKNLKKLAAHNLANGSDKFDKYLKKNASEHGVDLKTQDWYKAVVPGGIMKGINEFSPLGFVITLQGSKGTDGLNDYITNEPINRSLIQALIQKVRNTKIK